MLQRFYIGLEPFRCRLLPEQRLAEQVQIHAQTGGVSGTQMLEQVLGFRGEDDIGGLLAHLLADQGHGHPGKIAAEGLEALEQGLVQRGEKAGHPLHVQDVDQLIGRPAGTPGAHSLIGKLYERRLVVRTQHHALELSLLAALLRCLQGHGALLQEARKGNGPLRGPCSVALRFGLKLCQHPGQAFGAGPWRGVVVGDGHYAMASSVASILGSIRVRWASSSCTCSHILSILLLWW
jgi:hypothetical protein